MTPAGTESELAMVTMLIMMLVNLAMLVILLMVAMVVGVGWQQRWPLAH